MTTQCSSCGGFCGKRCQRENINMEKFVGSGAPVVPEQFKPDWNTEAVLVEEMQRMAKRIEDLEMLLKVRAECVAREQRPWVGLTDEEMCEAVRPLCTSDEVAKFLLEVSVDEYRAIEAKLKEKNT